MTRNKISNALQRAIDYCVNYDYDTSSSGCSCPADDYCRCSTITNCRVTSVDFNRLAESFCDDVGVKKDINVYCIDRLFRHSDMSNPNSYSVSVVSGYYGQETNGIEYDQKYEMVRKIESLLQMKDVAKIKYVLEAEYGYLLETIEGLQKCEIINVRKKDLKIGMPDHYMRLKKSIIESYAEYSMPIGIYVKSNDGFRIIDGYHRLKAFNESGKREAKIIVLS